MDKTDRTLYTVVCDNTNTLYYQQYSYSSPSWTYVSAVALASSVSTSNTYFCGLVNGYFYFLDGNNNNNNIITWFKNFAFTGQLTTSQLVYQLVCVNGYVCVCQNFTGTLLVYQVNNCDGSLTLVNQLPDNATDGVSAIAIGQDYAGNLFTG